MKNRFVSATALVLLLATSGFADDAAPAAATLAVGSRFPEIRLTDQNDAAVTVGTGRRLVLLTREMDGGNIVKETLATDGAKTLDAARAVYVSDVSGMPAMVTKMFALPAMKKRGYPIALDRDGSATAAIPAQPGKVTVVELNGGVVARVAFVGAAADLQRELAPKP